MRDRTPVITWQFNAKLLGLLMLTFVFSDAFEPKRAAVPFDAFKAESPILARCVATALVPLMLWVWTMVVRTFWSKFMTRVFDVREVTTQEAFACVIISGFFFGPY